MYNIFGKKNKNKNKQQQTWHSIVVADWKGFGLSEKNRKHVRVKPETKLQVMSVRATQRIIIRKLVNQEEKNERRTNKA